MAEKNGAAGPDDANQPEQQAPSENPSQFIINGQYIKDFSFENPNMLRMMQPANVAPDVNIDLSVNVQSVADASYEVVLQIRVETRREGITGFISELSYAGIVTLANWPREHVEPALFIEVPRLLFPFARSILATMTREGGFPPLTLNPIDFVELYRRRVAQQQAEGQATGAPQPEAVN